MYLYLYIQSPLYIYIFFYRLYKNITNLMLRKKNGSTLRRILTKPTDIDSQFCTPDFHRYTFTHGIYSDIPARRTASNTRTYILDCGIKEIGDSESKTIISDLCELKFRPRFDCKNYLQSRVARTSEKKKNKSEILTSLWIKLVTLMDAAGQFTPINPVVSARREKVRILCGIKL